ncbi:hypothetical protein K440DRAFT_415517 [Wilcoxina mikolae CBS 423.85]|nr:hypothetical protein K440DRAFT_415517 [Wilcoxina mikolae CBS 423.85]
MEDFVKGQTERMHKLRTELNTLVKRRSDEKRKQIRLRYNEIMMVNNSAGEVPTSPSQPPYLPTPPVAARPLTLTLPRQNTHTTVAAESRMDVSPLAGRSSGRSEAMRLTARQRESPNITDDEDDDVPPFSSRVPTSGRSFDSASTLRYESPDDTQTTSIAGRPLLPSPSPMENDEESAPQQSSRSLRKRVPKNYDVAAEFSVILEGADELETPSQKAEGEKEVARLVEENLRSPPEPEFSPGKPDDTDRQKAKGGRKRGPTPKKRPVPRHSSNEASSSRVGTKVSATSMTLEKRMRFGQSTLDYFAVS